MEKILLGQTGMEINRFGFGGIPIQTVDEASAVRTVLHALGKGVDFIDTSRVYTTSERRIGLALKESGRNAVLASKTPNRKMEGVRVDLETSLRELQVDFIDLYQCHFVRDMEDYRQRTGAGGAVEGLLRAREEGLIGHIGITSHSLKVLDQALQDRLFETVMVCFSFLEPMAREALIPKALAAGVGVIAMKSFSGGVIDNADLALKYVLSQPGVAIIPGVESPELFDRNWAVFEKGDYVLRASEKAGIERFRQRYDRTFCRRCDYCQPCSEQIPISSILHLRTIVKRMGRQAVEQPWLASGIAAARGCTQCGECLERCPYQLPIPDMVRENLEWLDDAAP